MGIDRGGIDKLTYNPPVHNGYIRGEIQFRWITRKLHIDDGIQIENGKNMQSSNLPLSYEAKLV